MAELTFRGTEIKTGPNLVFDIFSGFDDEAEVRGEDDIVPEASGQDIQPRIKNKRVVELRGYVLGTGANLAAQQASYRTNINTLRGLLDPLQAAGALVVTAPYMGLAASTKTLNVRYLGAMWGDIVMMKFRRVSIKLICVDSPPEWT